MNPGGAGPKGPTGTPEGFILDVEGIPNKSDVGTVSSGSAIASPKSLSDTIENQLSTFVTGDRDLFLAGARRGLLSLERDFL